MRSVSMRYLRDQGVGKSWLESKVTEEAERFCEEFIVPKLEKEICWDAKVT